MKIRKFSLRNRYTPTLFILLFGVFAPIGCAQTPKNLFSKVWGPDRITFKQAVGLGDSVGKKKTNNIFADKLGNKSGTKQTSKLAKNDSKTIGQKIGNFGQKLIPGFNRAGKYDKSVKQTGSANSQTKTRIEDARKLLASNNKPKADPVLRNLGKTSAAETLRKNRMRNNLKTNKSPTQSLYASRSAKGQSRLDKSRTNPFAEFLDTQNPKNPDQSRRSVELANTKTQGNTLAQADNPFADLHNQSNQKTAKEPVSKPTGSLSNNQFVAEFDESFEKIRREQEQFAGDDNVPDETGELVELNEFGGAQGDQSLASSSSGNTDSNESTPVQDTNLSHREKNREHVDRMMLSAHSELAKGRTVDAYNYARNAEEFAANEGVFFGPKEEHPGDLARSIRENLENTISQAEKIPPTNPVIVPGTRENALRNPGSSSEKTASTNPFAGSKPSGERYVALPQPPEQRASVRKNDSVPKYESFRALEKSNYEAFDPRTAQTSPPSHAELQTVIVEVSDPFGGMIVESETVPPRIPTQSVREKNNRPSIIRSADAQTTKYRSPGTIPQKVLNQLNSSKQRPADVDKHRAPQKQQSRSKSNRSTHSQEKKIKRVNSNQWARIITTNFQVPLKLDNVWHPVETKKQKQVKTAELTVVDVELPDKQKPAKVASEQPVVVSRVSFFQMGGSSDEKSQKTTSLATSETETGYQAGSRISEPQERLLIIICITIAGLIGFGIRRRDSLRLLWHRFASR